MNKIVIMHTESSPGWGGQEMRIVREIHGINKDIFKMVLIHQPGAGIGEKLNGSDIITERLKMRGSIDIKAIFAVRHLIDKYNPSIIHTHSSIDSWVASIAAFISSSKPFVVRTRHLGGGIKNIFVYKFLTHRIITLSEVLKRWLIEKKGIDRNKIVVIPTGIDIDRFNNENVTAARRPVFGLKDDEFVVGIVSILRLQKGHEYLLRAAVKLKKDIPKFKLLIVGAGPQIYNLKKLAVSLGLSSDVIFTGFINNVADVLRTMDLFILPSTEEALGTVLLEAMASEVPVIAANVGGIPEIFNDRESGYLIPPVDEDAIVSAIRILYKNEARRDKMKKNARAVVEERFSKKTMINKLENLYLTLVNQKN